MENYDVFYSSGQVVRADNTRASLDILILCFEAVTRVKPLFVAAVSGDFEEISAGYTCILALLWISTDSSGLVKDFASGLPVANSG
jgi:hypothetical protein